MLDFRPSIPLDYDEVKKFKIRKLFPGKDAWNNMANIKEICVGGLGKLLYLLGFDKIEFFDIYPGDHRLGFQLDSETDDFIVRVTMSVIPKVNRSKPKGDIQTLLEDENLNETNS